MVKGLLQGKSLKNSLLSILLIILSLNFSLLCSGCIDNPSNKISSYIYEVNLTDEKVEKNYLLNLTFYDNEKVNINLKDLGLNKSNQIQIPYKFENKSNMYAISYLLKDTSSGIDINVQIDKNNGTLYLKSNYLSKKGIFPNNTKFNVLNVENNI
ncbi:hypothetical protein J2127_000780 [Methanococcus voltae]|uniref:hypothetical protein n=1 Tax=Methanococcus voltae TaxID=2188 RepID=UPI001AE640E0|nr:hypothetical protein [Methanococcus voltae]MBP2143625.1 hypothetical protein [Methanococcus voltae]